MIEIIKTGINGLDTILNGGIVFEKEVVIVLRGGRGIYKTLLGMQMMLGIQSEFETERPQQNYPIRFYSLNKSDETLKKMFSGIVVSSEVENIKKGKTDELRSYVENIGGDYDGFETDIKRQIMTFDSNLSRFKFRGRISPITMKEDIRNAYNLTLKGYESADSQAGYISSDLSDFSRMMSEVEELPTADGQRQACIVVDGLSRMSEEELKRLPLENFVKELRNRSKVSILILNDKETLRNLDADIIIDMRRNYDSVHNYTFHELSVVKNVKGQFAFGWHKYKPMNGLIYVYPSIHKLLSQQHSVDNTFIQAINTNARYAQSFAEKNDVEPIFPNDNPEKSNVPANKDEILLKLITPQEDDKARVTSIIGNHNTFKRFLVSVSILNSILNGHEVFVLLLNEKRKGMLELIDKIRHDAGIKEVDRVKEAYEHLFFWEVRMGCISPDELVSFVLEYIQLQREKQNRQNKSDQIDIFIIDLGTIEQCFPMLNNESLFVPTLSTLCRENKVNLNLICNKHFSQRSVVCTVSDTLICTQRNNDKDLKNKEITVEVGAKNDAMKETKKKATEKKEETTSKEVPHLTLYLEKNDFGSRFNCRIFKMDAYNLFVPDYGNTMRFNVRTNDNGMVVFDVDTKEISTMKDYWRDGMNVALMP